MTERIFKNLMSPDLPVRFYSALAFLYIIHNTGFHKLLKPLLPGILQIYLKLMNEIEHDRLVQALERIIVIFHEDIEPFAIELA